MRPPLRIRLCPGTQARTWPAPAPRRALSLKTPTYQNTGSTARDHLASERTFLAWLRTGLGFIALGIAIERFEQLDLSALLDAFEASAAPSARSASSRSPAAATHNDAGGTTALVGALLGTGSGSIVYGTARYFSTQRLLERGLFRPAYWGAAGLGLGVAALAGGVYWSSFRSRRNRLGQDERRT